MLHIATMIARSQELSNQPRKSEQVQRHQILEIINVDTENVHFWLVTQLPQTSLGGENSVP